jgi:diacylglycerol kinase family enzyme
MRIALAANRASGGGVDPERLAAGRAGLPLAVIPTGTANDFARAAGLPQDADAAARLAVTGRRTRRLELGRLGDGRPFVNVASAGLASVAARRARPFKPRLGPLAYAVGAVHAALTEHPLAIAVRVDGSEVFAGRCWQAIVAVTGAFGGGGGVEEADPGDGMLDVVVVPAGSRLALVRRAWGMRTQTIARQTAVDHHRGSVVEARLPPGAQLNVDGEIRDRGLERVTVERSAYALVVG